MILNAAVHDARDADYEDYGKVRDEHNDESRVVDQIQLLLQVNHFGGYRGAIGRLGQSVAETWMLFWYFVWYLG